MFRAIGRYLRAIGALFTGRIDGGRKKVSSDPAVVGATYDRVIREKMERIHHYKAAVAALIAQQEKKKSQLRKLSEDIERLTKLLNGSAALAKKIVDSSNGDQDAVRANPEFQKAQSAYKDFKATLQEKEGQVAELEEDVDAKENAIQGHKAQLTMLLRDLEKIREEKHATTAEMISAKEEKEIADMLSGITSDKTHADLQEMRDLRDQAKAASRVSQEMAGVDTKRTESEFLEYATAAQSDSEFDALIGLTQPEETKKDKKEAVNESPTMLPEN